MRIVVNLWVWARVEQFLVQILVVVANIQMQTLKTEVGKGSMWTVFGHGLAGPKRQVWFHFTDWSKALCLERECRYYSAAEYWILSGNANKLREVRGNIGKRFLFFFTVVLQWNQIIWRYCLIAGRAFCISDCPKCSRWPMKIWGKRLFQTRPYP